MAWRSSGQTNDEMVSNMKRYGIITSPAVEEGFRAVDRRFFVPRNVRHLAHTDQPLREGNVHISAPHMYGSVVEALDLEPHSCTSFLNIGSGTGYLSCIVAHILGPASTHYAVDIHEDVIEHSRMAMEEWRESRMEDDDDDESNLGQMEMLHGNGLCINNVQGEGAVGLDRIYIGAAVEKRYLNQLVELLKPGGILVGPVDDELVKVHRTARTSSSHGVSLRRSLRGHSLSADFSLEVISSVRFFPLSERPEVPVTLPSRVWSPERHSLYPESFRRATRQILLCSRSPEAQPVTTKERNNVACKLPGFIWMEILSYTRRDWFEKAVPEEELLKKRLAEEQARSQQHLERLAEVESRLRQVEREKEVYRRMTVRLQRRLQNESHGADASSSENDLAAGAGDTVAPFIVRFLGLRAGTGARARPGAQRQVDSDTEEDEENDDYDSSLNEQDMDDDSVMSTESEVVRGTMNDAPMAARPQVRSVSISTED